MIGHIHTIIGRVKRKVLQFLSSLMLEGYNPIGLIDSVSNNNVRFVNNPCFKGDAKSQPLDTGIKRTEQNFRYSIKADISEIQVAAEVYLIGDYRSSANNSIRIFTTTVDTTFQLRDSIGFKTIVIPTNGAVFLDCYLSHENSIMTARLGSVVETLPTVGTLQTSTFNVLIGGRAESVSGLNINLFDYIYEVINLGIPTKVQALPLTETIVNSNHTYFDTIGSNHVQFVANLSNNGYQRYSCYGQLGYNIDVNGNTIPASLINPTLDALGNPILITQDGAEFLNYADARLKNEDIQKLKEADVHNVWFDPLGIPKEVTFSELEAAISTYPEVYGGDVIPGKSIKNISLK